MLPLNEVEGGNQEDPFIAFHFQPVYVRKLIDVACPAGSRQQIGEGASNFRREQRSCELFFTLIPKAPIRVDASKAGGIQAIALTHNPTTLHNSAPHADSREMTFDANGNLIEGDDGGIFKRTNPRGVGDWFGMHGNLTNTEIHSIAYDSRSNTLIAGAQDVGTPYQATAGAANWKEYTQGDGGVVAVDPKTLAANDQSIRYTSFFNFGEFTRSVFNASGALVFTAPAFGFI